MSIKKIIAIGSAKGGVGKSTLTAAIAKEYSKKFNVGILDADIYGPSQHILFNINNKPQFIKKHELKLIKPFKYENIELMTMGLMLDSTKAAAWRGPMLSGAIKQLINSTAWGKLDYLFIDMPPGTGDSYLTVFKELTVDGFILVSTPNILSIEDAKKTLNLVEKFNIKIIGFIENNISDSGNSIDEKAFGISKIKKLGSISFSKEMMNFDVNSESSEIKNIYKKILINV